VTLLYEFPPKTVQQELKRKNVDEVTLRGAHWVPFAKILLETQANKA
jgi:hypothetical protein